VKFGRVFFEICEICEWTDKQTDVTLIAVFRIPYLDEVISE